MINNGIAKMQYIGTSTRIIRLMIFILVGIVLWRLWDYVTPFSQVPNISNEAFNEINAVPQQTEHLVIPLSTEIQVTVYYEALCPDSRDFVMRELRPTYEQLGDQMALTLVPYGKATTKILADGTKSFQCQHGPLECRANIVHACAIKYVNDVGKSLEIVSCMIDLNIRSQDPFIEGRKCVSKHGQDWSLVEKCAVGEEGKEIMYHLGQMTHDLNPAVTFIPTITMNGSRENQLSILKDFKKAFCELYTGQDIPKACLSS